MTIDELKAALDTLAADAIARDQANQEAADAHAQADYAAVTAKGANDAAAAATNQEATDRDALIAAIQSSFQTS